MERKRERMGRRKSMGEKETSRIRERGRAWGNEGKRKGKNKRGKDQEGKRKKKERKNIGWVTDA